MKKIKLIPICFLLLICFCFNQCKKDHGSAPDNPYGLPNATQTGRDIFACRINGINAIAKAGIYNIGGGVHNDTLGVWAKFTTGNFFNIISLGIYGDFQINHAYDLKDTLHAYCLFGTDSTCQNIGAVTNIYPKIGNIILTKLDTTYKYTTQNIIAGTFNLKVPIPGCDTLNITDGRFDISY